MHKIVLKSMPIATWIRRAWTPCACLLLLGLLNNLAPGLAPGVTPNLELQQTAFRAARLAGQIRQVTPDEALAAEQVLQPDFAPGELPPRLLYIANSQGLVVAGATIPMLSAPQWLQTLLNRQGYATRVRMGVLPDLTPTEMLAELVRAGEAGQVEQVVVHVSLRRSTLGNTLRPDLLRDTPALRQTLRQEMLANPDLSQAVQVVSTALEDRAVGAEGGITASGLAGSSTSDNHPTGLVARAESGLQSGLESALPLYARRAAVQGWGVEALVRWRNRLFGVTSATARPYGEANARAYLELVEMSLRYARTHGLQVVLVLGPVRPQQPNPIAGAEVERFRTTLARLGQAYAVPFVDASNSLAAEYWTVLPGEDPTGFGGQPDFYHFTAAGHRRLAELILPALGGRP